MCEIRCEQCKEPIINDLQVIEVRQGFIEGGSFTPEEEVAFYHADCYPAKPHTSDQHKTN